MVYATLSGKMVDLLRSMIGNELVSYECAVQNNEIYGNLRINTSGGAVEVVNEVQELPFFDGCEDISFFRCCEAPTDKPFVSFCDEPVSVVPVSDKISEIEIVRDVVRVNDGNYEIAFDMAIIIKCQTRTIIFSRGWHFSEVISVMSDTAEVYPVANVVSDWENDGDNQVTVDRTIMPI